jgi:hypothetical protein
MSSCVTKHIDEFCDKFLSLNVSFGPESEFIVEAETLGNGTIPIASEVFQKYLPGTAKFQLLEETFKKSSGGLSTNSKFYDPVAKSFKTDTIAAGFGGDFNLGMEYFTIQGMPTHYGSPRNLTISRYNYVRNIWPLLDRKKDGSLYYIGVDGIVRQMSTNDPQQNQHVPGYPNPHTEFGEWYYTFGSVTQKFGIETYDFKTGGNLPSGAIAYPQGFFSDSGTIQSVTNSILSGSGAIAIGSSLFGGYKIIEAGTDLGKVGILNEVGISVPDEAESSSITKSYGDSYSSGAQVVSRVTGRVPDITAEEMGEINGGFEEVGYTVQQNQDTDERPGQYYSLTALNVFGEPRDGTTRSDRETYIWGKIKDLGVVREYGLALLIETGGTPVVSDEFIEKTYGYEWLKDSRQIYYNAEAAMNSGEALDIVRRTMLPQASESVNETLFNSKITNYNRFWMAANPGVDLYWSTNGDLNRDSNDPNIDQLVGFQNFGSANNPTGEKFWRSPSGGNISLVEFDTPIENTGFSDIKLVEDNEISTIADLVGESGEMPQTSGIILVDFGPIVEPSFSGIDEDFTRYETIIDFTKSNFDQNETMFGGLASIDTVNLKVLVNNLINKYGEIYDSMLNQNPSNPDSIYASGPNSYEVPRTTLKRINNENNGKKGYWGSAFINRSGPRLFGCRSNRARHNRSDSFSTVEFNINISPDGKNKSIGGGDEGIAFDTVNRTCANQVDIEYVEKINFTLINQLYDFEANPFHLRFLEGASITVNNGKLKASYTFSQKPYIPNFAKAAEGSASAKRFIGNRSYYSSLPAYSVGTQKGVVPGFRF